MRTLFSQALHTLYCHKPPLKTTACLDNPTYPPCSPPSPLKKKKKKIEGSHPSSCGLAPLLTSRASACTCRGAVPVGPPPGPSQQRGIQSRGRPAPVHLATVVQLRKYIPTPPSRVAALSFDILSAAKSILALLLALYTYARVLLFATLFFPARSELWDYLIARDCGGFRADA